MLYGTINWSISFEGFPTGNLTYRGIKESDINQFNQAYQRDLKLGKQKKVTIYGILFEVADYSYSRAHFVHRGINHFDRYEVSVGLASPYRNKVSQEVKVFDIISRRKKKISVSAIAKYLKVPYKGSNIEVEVDTDNPDLTISLQSAIESKIRTLGSFVSYTKGVEVKALNAGKKWDFATYQILRDGENTVSAPEYIPRSELSNFQENDDEDSISLRILDLTGSGFERREPERLTLVEADENYNHPPKGSQILRTIDSNSIDASGPRRTKIETHLIDGVTMKVVTDIWGFAYNAADIDVGNGVLAGVPSQHWQVIEHTESNYIYNSLPALTINAYAKDPNRFGQDRKINLLLNPDYEQFADISASGDQITFTSSSKYLTQVKTTGWSLARLRRETDSLESLDTEDPARRHYFFKKIPKIAETTLLLRSQRKAIGSDASNVPLPFSIEWIPYNELPASMRKFVGSRNLTDDARVGVITPDLEYTEPMLIMTEINRKNSFAYAPNPESDPPDDILPPNITGEESYVRVERTIIDETHYREKITEFSAQGPGFADAAEVIRTRQVAGSPPLAQTFKTGWEKKDGESRNKFSSRKTQRITYIVESNLVPIDAPEGGSISAPGVVSSRTEVKKAIETDLRIRGLSNSQSSKTVSWFYPDIREGDLISSYPQQIEGKWRVTGASWSLEFQGRAGRFTPLLITTGGTQLNLGLDRKRTVSVTKKTEKAPQPEFNQSDPSLDVSAVGGETSLTEPDLNVSNRRRF